MSHWMGRRAIERHLSAADERFGLRLGAGLVATFVAAVTFALILLLVRGGWAPLRSLDTGAAETFNRIDTARPELTKAAEVVSDVFGPNVFRVALTVIALVYVIHGERHHATWLVFTVFGGAALGFTLKEVVGRARPVLPDPVSTAPGMSFPSGHALGASIGCCLLLLITLRFLSRGGQGRRRHRGRRDRQYRRARAGCARRPFRQRCPGRHHARHRLGGHDDMGLRRMAARDRTTCRAASRCGHLRAARSTSLTCWFPELMTRESINGGVGIPQHACKRFRWHRP